MRYILKLERNLSIDMFDLMGLTTNTKQCMINILKKTFKGGKNNVTY